MLANLPPATWRPRTIGTQDIHTVASELLINSGIDMNRME